MNCKEITIRTTGSPELGNLSFFEAEQDIPFRICRFYTIFKEEQDRQQGYHVHKRSWHMLFCPYGSIEVMVDTGKERKTVALNDPSTGLILQPGVWFEMVWKKPGSVLCVASSDHYDMDCLWNDNSDSLKHLQEKEWSATVESAEVLGEGLA